MAEFVLPFEKLMMVAVPFIFEHMLIAAAITHSCSDASVFEVPL
jgi:hypothetical protein